MYLDSALWKPVSTSKARCHGTDVAVLVSLLCIGISLNMPFFASFHEDRQFG